MLQSLLRAALVCAFAVTLSAAQAGAQSLQPEPRAGTEQQPAAGTGANISGNLFGVEELRQQLRQQREEIELLRAALGEQVRALEELRTRVERAEQREAGTAHSAHIREAAYDAANSSPLAGAASNNREAAPEAVQGAQAARATQATPGTQATSGTQGAKPAEGAAGGVGPITFSGDIRLRYESFYGQQNTQPSADVPGAFGNPLSTRQRFRMRARLAARGRFGEEFEWGLRFSTGNAPDVGSTNQSMTDFFSRKSFWLDQAFVVYKPKAAPGLQLQGGKFEAPWWRTELVWDNDIQAEGFNERYVYRPKKSKVSEVSFVAWQLPFLERNAAFVVGADGRIDFEQSRRGGRDLALYGGQARIELAPTADSLLRLAVTDNFYSGTQFINPAQFLGPNLQLPVTVNIPETDGAPARTVTGQVSIPRDLLVSGNANLGLSTATNNALNSDGRLASGFNLLDFYGQLELNRRGRWPLLAIVNYVKNTQARDFFAVGTGNSRLLVENDEDQGFWAEFQIGRDLLRLRPEETRRGDLLFNYTYALIEKDAVLTPFNFSDFIQQSDVRAHRFIVAYAVDPRVSLSLTGIFSRRANGLLGPFVVTPPGSLDRALTRLQLDTTFRF
jgi:TolA-binding protein